MKIKLSSKIYPLNAVLNACYAFIDRAYIYLDSNSKAEDITVFFKSKNGAGRKKNDCLRGEFMNELLHCVLRNRISKENKKIREYIVGRALYSASPLLKKGEARLAKSQKDLDYKKDPLGIAVPWEKRYGSKLKQAKHKV